MTYSSLKAPCHFLCAPAVCPFLYLPWLTTVKTQPLGFDPETCNVDHEADCSCLGWLNWKLRHCYFVSEQLFKVFTVTADLFRPSTLIPFALVVGWCYQLTIWFSESLCFIVVSVLFMLGAEAHMGFLVIDRWNDLWVGGQPNSSSGDILFD